VSPAEDCTLVPVRARATPFAEPLAPPALCRPVPSPRPAAAESTNERIAYYTVAETFIVVGLSAAQVMLVRMWFAASRGLPGGLM